MKNGHNRSSEKVSEKNTGYNSTDAQVDELLQATQDDVLLNLSLNSHMSRVSPDYLPSDLDRRFRALKSQPSPSPPHKPSAAPAPLQPSSLASRRQEDDDLFTRFAALKGSMYSSSSQSSADGVGATPVEGGTADGEDEVEKIIQWAVDSARLDPSPPSDDDGDTCDREDEDDNEDDSDTDDDDVLKKIKKDKKVKEVHRKYSISLDGYGTARGNGHERHGCCGTSSKLLAEVSGYS